MRRAMASFLVLAVLLALAAPAHAWGRRGRAGHHGIRTRVFIGVGPSVWWGPYPHWYYPPPYYVYSPPPVIVQEPPVYVQQAPAPPAPPQAYWYYCQSARGYYPSVPTCPEPWVKVPPRSE